ncbi:hypothetical protein DL95DRAFT_501439 [Leptodontidium sp. 2 PMI_412]|nr:hypothetical protein DL95DRAFT_501439 [Leptodontidium sp. 2 PMI_412]
MEASQHHSPSSPTGKPIPIPLTDKLLGTSLEVFGQTFHVQSEALKARSAYFRDQFTRPGTPIPAENPIKYAFVTLSDKDKWKLVWSGAEVDNGLDIESHNAYTQSQNNAFGKLLCAIHEQPYNLADILELKQLYCLSRNIGAHAALSMSLLDALLKSPNVVEEIPLNSHPLLEMACILRHAVLYRECMIHAINPFHNPRFMAMTNGCEVKKLAIAAHKKMEDKIETVRKQLLDTFDSIPSIRKECAKNEREMRQISIDIMPRCSDAVTGRTIFPRYFRELWNYDKYLDGRYQAFVGPLIDTNKLAIDQSGRRAGDPGLYEDCFLSLEISDEDLPFAVAPHAGLEQKGK